MFTARTERDSFWNSLNVTSQGDKDSRRSLEEERSKASLDTDEIYLAGENSENSKSSLYCRDKLDRRDVVASRQGETS